MGSQHLAQKRNSRAIADRAKSLIGKPYKHLGRGLHGVDCLGLAAYALDMKVDDHVPAGRGASGYFVDPMWDHHKGSMENKANSELLTRFVSEHLLIVRWDEIREGDLITFGVKLGEGFPDHVGIFIGGGQFVHATKDGVVAANFNRTWLRHALGVYRVKNG